MPETSARLTGYQRRAAIPVAIATSAWCRHCYWKPRRTRPGESARRSYPQHRQFHFVALVAVVAVCLGGLGIHSVEGGENTHIQSYGDGLWWAIVTVTTVGYGDISPTTTEGRVIATCLMLLGIGVIGAFTATVASFFVQQEEGSELAAIEARLARLEQKLDALLDRRDRDAE